MKGAQTFLDRLGDPFLFAEERVLSIRPGGRRHFRNGLPKVLFFLEGEVLHSFENGEIARCQPGSILVHLTTGGQTYFSSKPQRAVRVKVIRVTFPRVHEPNRRHADDFSFYLRTRFTDRVVMPPCKSRELPYYLGEIRRALPVGTLESRHRVNALLRLAFLEVFSNSQSVANDVDNAGHTALLDRADAFIERNLHRPFSLEEVAAAVDRSEEHLARLYKAGRGQTVFQEVRRRRVEKAKYYLLCTDLPIREIAEQTGFVTGAHFSRIFSQVAGKTPSAIRREADFGAAALKDEADV